MIAMNHQNHAMRRPISPLLFSLFLLGFFVGCQAKPYTPGPAINPSAFMQVVETLTHPDMEGRDAGTKGIDLARDFIVDRFKSLGLEPAFVIDGKPSFTQPLMVRTGRDEQGKPIKSAVENVGALLPGQGVLANEVIVIGAHYDHIGYGHYASRDPNGPGHLHPGADDNASGTAGVLLLARHFAMQKRLDGLPRRTIFFTGFAAEERGLFGSSFMVNHPDQWAFDHEQISGMINMDMIGRLRKNELYVFTDATGQQWRPWINSANKGIELDIRWDVQPPGGSDHVVFIRAGIPAVFFNTWLHEDLHTPRDTADKINGRGGARVVQVVANLIEQSIQSPERITFVTPKPKPPRAYLGAMLGRAERGVAINEVMEDGPLDKAGVIAGDVLLVIDGQAMKNPGDVRGFLGKAEAGAKAKLTIKRGEEEIEITMTLGVRR